MRLGITVRWKHILAVSAFCSDDIERFDIWGVRVEFTPTADDEWPAVAIAIDGRRLAAVETKVKATQSWPFGVETAFTIPRPLLKRVKKPKSDDEFALAYLSFDVVNRVEAKEGGDEGEAEEVQAKENIAVFAGWDDVQVSMRAMPQRFPAWRAIIPPEPYNLARGVKVHAGELGDFSGALERLGAAPSVALYRSIRDLADIKKTEADCPLIVKGKLDTFVGLIMPPQMEISSQWELPLWAKGEED